MTFALFVASALAHIVYLWFALRLWQRNRSVYTLIVIGVIAALAYDNSVIAAGGAIGEGPLLEGLNWVRFALHALLTPLMIMFAWGMAERFDLSWTQSRAAMAGFGLLAAVMVGLGVQSEVVALDLVAVEESGVLRYSYGEPSGPPIPSIVVILVSIAVGASLWRQRGWYVLCVGSMLMFVLAGAGASVILLANLGEVVYAGVAVCTDTKTSLLTGRGRHRRRLQTPGQSRTPAGS